MLTGGRSALGIQAPGLMRGMRKALVHTCLQQVREDRPLWSLKLPLFLATRDSSGSGSRGCAVCEHPGDMECRASF